MPRIGLTYYHLLDYGGVERHLQSLINIGSQQGYTFTLFAPVTDRFKNRIRVNGVDFVPWKEVWKPLNPLTPLFLAKEFSKENIDIVHSHDSLSAIPGRIASSMIHLPGAVTIHLPTREYHGKPQTIPAIFGRSVYIGIDKFLNWFIPSKLIYVSKKICQFDIACKHSPANKTCVIPNGIDLSIYRDNYSKENYRRTLGDDSSSIVIAFVGRMEEQKGVPFLLEAFKRIYHQIPNIRLWLAGDGSRLEKYKALANELKIEESVHFLGQIDNISAMLKSADFFVLPSLYEAMPYGLIEALSAGLPCIVTQTGDNELIIQEALAGVVVPVGNSDALAQAMLNLALNPSLREQYKINAINASEMFNEVDMVKKILNVYESIFPKFN